MPKHWAQISIDEILNYDDLHTGQIARYERILQHQTNQAMSDLLSRLQEVMATTHNAEQLAQERGDQTMLRADEAASALAKQQKAMKWLTFVLAGCTILYTGINGWVAYEIRMGNDIQTQVAVAVKEQAKAAQEANVLQRQAITSEKPSHSISPSAYRQ